MYCLKHIFVFILSFLLFACNVQPIYQHDKHYLHELCSIELEMTKSIDAAEFYDSFFQFSSNNCPIKYKLVVTLNLHEAPSVIQKNSSILRRSLTYSANYKLLHNEQLLTSNNVTSSSAYNENTNSYSLYTQHEHTKQILIQGLASDIRNRILLYLLQHHQ